MKSYAGSRKQLILSANHNILKGAITHVPAANIKQYGFDIDPNQPLWKSKNYALKVMYMRLLDRQPSYTTFHNIKGKELTYGLEQLLDLLLNFLFGGGGGLPVHQVTKIVVMIFIEQDIITKGDRSAFNNV
jgi:hypothetical protein